MPRGRAAPAGTTLSRRRVGAWPTSACARPVPTTPARSAGSRSRPGAPPTPTILPAAGARRRSPSTARTAAWAAAITAPPTPRHHVLVALEGEWRVGFVAFGPADDLEPDDPEPATHRRASAPLLVEPRWGRRGHGSRLLAAAVDHAREDGMTRAIAWIPEGDTASREFLHVGGLGARTGWPARSTPAPASCARSGCTPRSPTATRRGRAVSFTGIPLAALDFYEDLEADNSKAFWTAHKHGVRRVGEGAAGGAARRARASSSARPSCSAPTATSGSQGQDAVQDAPGRVVRRDRRCTCRSRPPGCSWPAATGTRARRRWTGCGARSPTTSPGRSSSARSPASRRRKLDDRRRAADPRAVRLPKDHPRAELLRYKTLTASRDARLPRLAGHAAAQAPRSSRRGAASRRSSPGWTPTSVATDRVQRRPGSRRGRATARSAAAAACRCSRRTARAARTPDARRPSTTARRSRAAAAPPPPARRTTAAVLLTNATARGRPRRSRRGSRRGRSAAARRRRGSVRTRSVSPMPYSGSGWSSSGSSGAASARSRAAAARTGCPAPA